ncbi:hypothetical protein B5M42_004205 [Paenibacillus athensensis]|uniref:hypothetical protein n=1 Tax=Paenibacillus athensensis TaxID=1967502 RepID=UPI00106F6FCB|nr:hypothetical protein [Paenibacillus athensensis]MCD1258040.1 hypothetical protein [Paenibacillus athensensis]
MSIENFSQWKKALENRSILHMQRGFSRCVVRWKEWLLAGKKVLVDGQGAVDDARMARRLHGGAMLVSAAADRGRRL